MSWCMGGPLPNPVREMFSFDLHLERPTRAEAAIYDVTGAKVARATKQDLPAGKHSFSLASSQSAADQLAPGVHHLTVRGGEESESRSPVFLK